MGQSILELLYGGHHGVAHSRTEEASQVPGARRLLRRWEAAPLEGVGNLPVQLRPVCDYDDGRVGEARLPAQLRRQPKHGQRLARSLRVPDHAAPLLRLAAREQPLNRSTYGAVLLVAGQLLHQPSPLRLVDHVVAQYVQKHRGRQQTDDELGLPLGLYIRIAACTSSSE